MKKTSVCIVCLFSLALQGSDQSRYKSAVEFFRGWYSSLQNPQPSTPSEAESFTSAIDQDADTEPAPSSPADSTEFYSEISTSTESFSSEESDADDNCLSREDEIDLEFHRKQGSKAATSSQSKKESPRRTTERLFKCTNHQKTT